MNLKVINGKVVGRKQTHVQAPSPAEIAGRAYDRAVSVALRYHVGEDVTKLKAFMESAREGELAALRDEVINRRKG